MINNKPIRTLKIIGHYDIMMEVYIIRKDNLTYNWRPVSMSRAEQSRAEQSRAEQSRAEQSRAEQSRAEQRNNVVFIIKSFIRNRVSVSSDCYFALPGNGVA